MDFLKIIHSFFITSNILFYYFTRKKVKKSCNSQKKDYTVYVIELGSNYKKPFTL